MKKNTEWELGRTGKYHKKKTPAIPREKKTFHKFKEELARRTLWETAIEFKEGIAVEFGKKNQGRFIYRNTREIFKAILKPLR